MSRYISRPRAIILDGDADSLSMTADQVIITDDQPTPVGLVDSHGHAIYRIADRIQIGFVSTKQTK